MDTLPTENISPPNEYYAKTFFASCFRTLEDLAKSPFIPDRHVHCQFPYEDYKRFRVPIERQLMQVGVVSLYFRERGIVELPHNIQKQQK